MEKSSQQRWNESNPEKIIEAQRKYRKGYKQISIKISKKERRELIEWYDSLSKEEKADLFTSMIDFMEKYKQSH